MYSGVCQQVQGNKKIKKEIIWKKKESKWEEKMDSFSRKEFSWGNRCPCPQESHLRRDSDTSEHLPIKRKKY